MSTENGRLREVDFSTPTTFERHVERRLRKVVEVFCGTASTRLSAEVRGAVELEPEPPVQLTWASAQEELAADAVGVVVEVPSAPGRMVLVCEHGFVLEALERLLGGGGATPQERRLSEIDWALVRHVLGAAVAQLSAAWQEELGDELSVVGADLCSELLHLAGVGEPTLVVPIALRLDGSASAMHLLIPWTAVADRVARLAEAEAGAETDPESAARVRAALAEVDVELRAEVAARELAIDDVLALRQGDLLRLGGTAAEGMTLYADGVAVQRVRAGRSGRHRAVQVLAPGEPGA